MRFKIFLLLAACVCFIAASAFPQSILVWDKDHNKLFPDPEGGGNVDATYGVTKALAANGYLFTTTSTLPSDLGPYDIVFIVMGTYC